MKFKVKVEGLKALDQALGQLKEATAKRELRAIAVEALGPFDEEWRSRAPVEFHDLEESGGIGRKLSRSQRRLHERESFVEVPAGPGPHPQAVQQEFGNSTQPPQPFVRPAWENNKFKALDIVRTGLGGRIERAAARARRKAAKLAAKG